MFKPKKTQYSSSSDTAVELAWVLKRITETHDLGQRRIMEEARKQSETLTAKLQGEQYEVFHKLIAELGISADDYGDGKAWALNIANLDQNVVTMVHRFEVESEADDCDCPICTLRRTISGEEPATDENTPPAKDRLH